MPAPDYNKPADPLNKMDCRNAMFDECFPCNPRPFVTALGEIVRDTGCIDSDDAKRVLWILMTQAYGQLGTIDLSDEWSRLYNLYGGNLEDQG